MIPTKNFGLKVENNADEVLQYFTKHGYTNYYTNKHSYYWIADNGNLCCHTPDESIKIYTLEEILEMEKALPEKWCIQGCKELGNYCREKINGKFRTNVNGNYANYYYYKTDRKVDLELENWVWTNNPITDGYTIISFEQFQQFILKNQDMNKELIGYKLKEDCKQYEQAACKIAFVSDLKNLPSGYCISKESIAAAALNEAGVLDLWFEPVFKEDELKVGSWVITTQEDFKMYNKYSKGEVFKVTKVSNEYVYYEENSSVLKHRIRKATQQEIQNHLISLAKEKGFVDGINYLDAFISRDAIIAEKTWSYNLSSDGLYNNGNQVYSNGKWATIVPQKEVVTLKCDSGSSFTLEVSKEGVYYAPELTWLDVDNIRFFISQMTVHVKVNSYQFDCANVNMGCKKSVPFSDLKKVLDIYDKFQQ